MDDLLRIFLTEATENLDAASAALAKLERDPGNAEITDTIFRLIHTLKGSCGFLELPRFDALVRSAGILTEKLRDEKPALPETLELAHAAIERMQSIIAAYRASNPAELVDEDEKHGGIDKLDLVIFRAGDQRQKAVPLQLVTRLEKIDAADIVQADGNEAVDYKGTRMLLVRAATANHGHGLRPMLVFSDAGRFIGLVVDDIIGIIEGGSIIAARDRPGVIATALAGGNAADVIDLGHYLPRLLKSA